MLTMAETNSSGERKRQPPTPDQFRTIGDLVATLAPDIDEIKRRRDAGRYNPNAKLYEFVDDQGIPHNVNVADYRKLPDPANPELLMSVGDTETPNPYAPTHYRIVNEGNETVFKVEKVDATTFSSAYGEAAGISLAELAAAAMADNDSMEAADELGLNRGNADQAQTLINTLEAVRDRGIEDTE